MRVFEHPNMANFLCPICGRDTDEPVVLVSTGGRDKTGIMKAVQVHLDCIDLELREVDDKYVLVTDMF